MNLTKEIINNYGIIYTPNYLVNNILDLIPKIYFKNPNLKWLDIGAGCGAFSINLYNRLYNDLSDIIINNDERKNHIIKNMIYMVENYNDHIIVSEKSYRDNESLPLIGDIKKIKKNTGWRPKINFRDMIIEMIEKELRS